LSILKGVENMECKKCGCDESIETMKGPHLGIYCKQCGAWQGWKKHTTSTKTSEDYKNEYLDKQPATESQVYYIKNLLVQNKITKFVAGEVIKLLGGEV